MSSVRPADVVKRVVLGRPMASGELGHTLLPKTLALPVFSSDPLSSNAYATQEILLVLALAGASALSNVVPIAIAVACLLGVVVTSYRQTVRAYPAGGGAYRVSKENLGTWAGLAAGGALLTDYILTVSVSVTAGSDAIVSAAPQLAGYRVTIAVGAIGLVTLANLRGVRESGTLFAFPTYGFVLIVYIMLVTGFVKCLGGCPLAESAGKDLEVQTALSFWLILKAFAAGTTALTGVEAIADGVQAFRYPQSRNAATTLLIMGVLAITMFLGISWLADHTNVVFEEHDARTVLAQVGHAVFGGGPLFYVLQAMTAGILFLAANTAYQDFPRLSSILAQDRFLPRQLINRGDRLVFSNGVLILALLAAFLVIIFGANLNRLIQLYLVGVFISFTLSQSGMVIRWRRIKGSGWRHGILISGVGAVVTGIVFFVIVSTKFIGGAWIIVTTLPVLIYIMHSIHRHYSYVSAQLEHPGRRPGDRRLGDHHFVILVTGTDTAAARAVGYLRSVRPGDVVAVTFDSGACGAWPRLAPDIPMHVLAAEPSEGAALKAWLRSKRKTLGSDDFLTVVVPELLRTGSLLEVVRHPRLHRLKASLLAEAGVQVMDLPIVREGVDPNVDHANEPVRRSVVVLASALHNGTLEAIEYGEALRPADIRAVHFALDPLEAEHLGTRWLDLGVPVPLEIEDSPFRDIGTSLVRYLDQLGAGAPTHIVTVIIPEMVVGTRRHQLLHGQSALILKRHLLGQGGVVTVSVPYHV
jgi:amino acid transporter